MSKMYYDSDCDLSVLKNKRVAIIGYGSQGHAHALNLHDSGIDVVVGLYNGSKSWAKAEDAGLKVMTTEEAVKCSDVIMILVNDEKQAKLYHTSIEPYLTKGKYLAFAHGFNIHFGQIKPSSDINVIMIAPKGPGHTVRSQYLEGKGVPSLIAVAQDPSGDSTKVALAYASGIGAGRAGIFETTFKEETETDLFGEQAVLCGGVQGGMEFMRYSISDTAEYGDYITENKIITEDTKKAMRGVLSDIQDGTFARNWLLENQVNRPYFNARRRQEAETLLEATGKKLRGLMSWLKK